LVESVLFYLGEFVLGPNIPPARLFEYPAEFEILDKSFLYAWGLESRFGENIEWC
jgi:hypothetical protein